MTKEKAGEKDFWIDDHQKKGVHFFGKRGLRKMYGYETAEKKKSKKGLLQN